MNNKTLDNGALLFFAVLIVGLVISFFSQKNYKASNQEVISKFEQQDYYLSYDQLHSALTNKDSHYLFIDLRHEAAFAEAQIPGAVNIPFESLLERKSIKVIKKNKKLIPVLYAGEEATAQKARMLLLSKGINEVMVLGGNFETAQQHALENFDPAYAFFRDEKARFDYMRFMQGSQTQAQEKRPSATIPETTTQTVSVQGGC